MTFTERMKQLLEQGVSASKDLALKAGAKAQDLGERGMCRIEIKQLEIKAQKLIGKLGNETYSAFIDRNLPHIERNIPEFDALLTEISILRQAIEKKEDELHNRNS
ncbi:MAG: hypothetical protein FWH41_05790 [Treponema sp.]|nr:hypothetical protein [Treponema sp.]